jgi:choline dehydrogenase-like flavoprotein
MYVEGHGKNGLQYHVQVSAFSATDPQSASLTFDHEAPDAAAAPSPQQLTGSQDHVVFVCATLGEIGENNASNWIAPDGRRDPTTNIRLQLLLGPQELELWDTLDEATEQTIVAMALGPDGKAPNVEYWSDEGEGGWGGDPPEPAERRLNIIVHEASPLWMGTDPDCSVVDTNFRPHGVPNVYVTGGAIFPTSGSWNPTLTMCGLAQSLADELS